MFLAGRPFLIPMGSSEQLAGALKEVVTRGDFAVPPYPAVALRLQKLLASPSHGIGDVADVIAADAALAAAILAAANSAVQKGAQEITTLSRAVNRLGARAVASLALAAGVGAGAMTPGVLFDVKYRAWRRSLTCALLCQKLAPHRELDAEESFLAGLLHGFGRSVAIASLEKVIQQHKPSRPLSVGEWLSIAEKNRAELALTVAQRWKLPQEIVSAFDPATDDARSRLLVDADRMAAQIDVGETPSLRNPSEAAALDDFLRGLPQALLALAPPPDDAGKPNDAVAALERPSSCDKKPSGFVVTDLRAKAPASLTCLGIGCTTLELESSRPFQESSVARVAVGKDEPSLNLWLNVVCCIGKGGNYHVEMQLFSTTKELREQWQALYRAA